MGNENVFYIRANNVLCFAGLAFVLLFVVFNKATFTFDEPYYLNNVELIKQYGFTNTFLIKLGGPAGPLHSVVHWMLQPITRGSIVPTRLVNVVFLLASIYLIYGILKQLGIYSFSKALCFMCIPTVYTCVGMALTEMPALFFMLLSLWMLHKALFKENHLYAIVGGLFLSIAIMGRQPYILILFGLPVLLFGNISKSRITLLVLYSIFALVIPIYVFNVWGGIVPHLGGETATRHLFAARYFFISLGYAFAISLFLAPSWFIKINFRHLWLFIIGFLLILVLCVVADFRMPVMATVSKTLLPASLYGLYEHFMGAALLLLGVYFVASLLYRAHILFTDKEYLKLFYIIACFGVLLSTLKITHQFSARYIFQAAPLFFFFLADNIQFNLQSLLLRTGAILIGIVSLLSYF
jgi:4-amino-4-deoxy-L-arabinose transferase-like glycosyltransferase